MMSTDYPFHRPRVGTTTRKELERQERVATVSAVARLRTAILVVAANVAGLALLIWTTS